MRSFFLLITFGLLLSACSVFGKKEYDQQLKSPCAGVKGSPCSHIPVNDWWLLGENRSFVM